MKKFFVITLLICSLTGFSQSRDYKGALINFHKDLLAGRLRTPEAYKEYSFEGHAVEEDEHPGFIKQYNALITNVTGSQINPIIEKIQNSKILDYGSPSSVQIELIFGDDFLIYSLNKYEDEPITIGISLNGLSLFNHIIKDASNVYKTERYAVINDPDGYTNVRKEPSSKSGIVTRVDENQVFIYYPSPKASWIEVLINNETTGFMHKSRIKPVYELEAFQRKQVEKCWVRWENCSISN
ncbi:MAG: SH3 domain-containing protein [Cyclobacteriaceae bacterium]